jgi:Cu(I)/Ag(I) efflux system membrane fusion protein
MSITHSIKKASGKKGTHLAGAVIIGLLLGWILFSGSPSDGDHNSSHAHDATSVYTCSMHPQIRLSEPGQCPICFMDLIPLEGARNDLSDREISLSDDARTLAEVRTSPVRKGNAEYVVELTGRIDYDETRVKNISAWFPGRLERLFVDYTGIPVKKGDHLFDIYSPQLYSAQEELLQAQKRLTESGSVLYNKGTSASREKARLLGLTELQIDAILERGTAEATLQINSPMSGIVTHKMALQGTYVKTGDEIYTIADLSQVWLVLEAYEQDLPWLTYGQKMKFSVAGIPGKQFDAQISYIDPLVTERSRTVTIRAVLDNREGQLKPGMLVNAEISAQLSSKGKVITPDLAGKWTCPMHPEVLKSKRGVCDVCEMNLIPIQGVSGLTGDSEGLLVPVSSVLKTGDRSLVYVESSSSALWMYELREVILGPRVGDEYLVIEGLDLGDKVVTSGNFKIDSAMQIAGKLSMMNMPEVRASIPLTDAQQTGLGHLLESYLALQEGLADDDLVQAKRSLVQFGEKQTGLLKQFEPGSNTHGIIRTANIPALDAQSSLSDLRVGFDNLSAQMIALQGVLDLDPGLTFYQAFCPMAFDNRGATWLQTGKEINNPYFGDVMLRCGEIQNTYLAKDHNHE